VLAFESFFKKYIVAEKQRGIFYEKKTTQRQAGRQPILVLFRPNNSNEREFHGSHPLSNSNFMVIQFYQHLILGFFLFLYFFSHFSKIYV
jgi:hypothetical protein